MSILEVKGWVYLLSLIRGPCTFSLILSLPSQGSGGSFNLSGSGDMFLGMPGLNGDSYPASQVRRPTSSFLFHC